MPGQPQGVVQGADRRVQPPLLLGPNGPGGIPGLQPDPNLNIIPVGQWGRGPLQPPGPVMRAAPEPPRRNPTPAPAPAPAQPQAPQKPRSWFSRLCTGGAGLGLGVMAGFMVGGPIGAVIGGLAGTALGATDNKFSQYLTKAQNWTDVLGDVAIGAISVAAFAAGGPLGLAAAAVVAGGAKMLIQAAAKKFDGDENGNPISWGEAFKDWKRDFCVGFGVALISPLAAGVGTAVGRACGGKVLALGTSKASTLVGRMQIYATKDVVLRSSQTGLQKFGIIAARRGTEGAIFGGLDNGFRAWWDGKPIGESIMYGALFGSVINVGLRTRSDLRVTPPLRPRTAPVSESSDLAHRSYQVAQRRGTADGFRPETLARGQRVAQAQARQRSAFERAWHNFRLEHMEHGARANVSHQFARIARNTLRSNWLKEGIRGLENNTANETAVPAPPAAPAPAGN